MQHDGNDRRLTQLRVLVDRLERLPASPRKEWMLQEARARMVDVETGYEPRPMRSLREEPAEPPPEPPGRRTGGDRAVKRPSATPAAAAAPPPAAPEPPPSRTVGWQPTAATVFTDEVLWLEDPPGDTDAEAGGDSKGIAPWRRGLRG
jgi:hypothetical protein